MPEYEPKHGATEESSVAPAETEPVEPDEAEGLDKRDQPVESMRDKRDKLDQPDGSDPRPPVDWRELVRDFVKPGRAQVVFAAILLILGLGVAMQVRSQAQQTDYSTMRRADLVQLLDDLNSESRRLEAEIAQLEETKRQLQSGADSERVAREEAQRRLDVLAILGGTAPAQGSGIRVVIDDPNHKVTPELLLNTIEELRDAGAEVIAINQTVRVVASTWFASGRGGIVVDDQTITAPISIDVIGEPHALTEALRFSGGLVSEVQNSRVGGTVSIVSDPKVTIEAVVSPPIGKFAKPA